MTVERLDIRAELKLVGFSCSVDHLTRIIGIHPHETWRVGDLIPDRPVPVRREQTTWLLRSPSMARSADEAVSALLGLLPNRGAFRSLPPGVDIEISVVVYGYGTQPGFGLSAESVRALAEIGADLDVDAYYLPIDS